MITKENPIRLESEDITSAILEGVDAFILSHETSIGLYPKQAVV